MFHRNINREFQKKKINRNRKGRERISKIEEKKNMLKLKNVLELVPEISCRSEISNKNLPESNNSNKKHGREIRSDFLDH